MKIKIYMKTYIILIIKGYLTKPALLFLALVLTSKVLEHRIGLGLQIYFFSVSSRVE